MTNSKDFFQNYSYKNFLIHHYHQVTSTNDLAKELLNNRQIFANEIILSDIQTIGKGRMNRQWQSPLGNLYFSLCVDLSMINSQFLSTLPLFCGIVLNKTISNLSAKKLNILNKWPNDLLIENKKIAGILVENTTINDNQKLAIIGIGVNINNNPNNTRFASGNLSEFDLKISNLQLLEKFLDEFDNFFKIWEKFGFKNLKKIWLEKAYQLHQKVTINLGKDNQQNLFTGIFNDIDEYGNIIIIKDQKNFTISVGDVS
ncbi:biotin--[acetyl-CoA-carboxylase] ligase [Alphaproteobacteria bacterium]|nr:biotin--[acetyl-CoA-carboxylase] ligase [Alphaproteobacteria bacterium]